jgi:Fe-S-cluster containining protein
MKYSAGFALENRSNANKTGFANPIVSRETKRSHPMNFEPYFKKYRQLVEQVDAAFNEVKSAYEDCVSCKIGCADCCHALFDLSLVEALYMKNEFDQKISDPLRTEIIERANIADRKTYKLKRQAHIDQKAGKSENDILEWMAVQRIRCPLLNDEDQCELYDSRPITCRLYGVPTVIGEKAYTCGLSGFKEGEPYSTVKLDAIQQRLFDISRELAEEIRSRYPRLAEMLVPLSMALLTDYTEEYLGLKTDGSEADQKKGDG